jgi:hypothetical protein
MKFLTPNTEITAETRGQVITGKVVKVNRTTCLITVSGGNTRFSVGSMVKVPFSIITVPFKCGDHGMEVTSGDVVGGPAAPAPKAFEPNFFWVTENAFELLILDGLYSQLSPENLSCDGECSRSEINRKRNVIERKMRAIETIIGVQLDESQLDVILNKYQKEIVQSVEGAIGHFKRVRESMSACGVSV